MYKQFGYPPIIIIGMHRSGTSMITHFLEEMGLFIGKKKDENNEAIFFQNLNKWLLRQSGGSWDNPTPIKYLLNNKEASILVTDYMRNLMKTPHAISFLGWHKYLRNHTPEKLCIPWGWKDPRNTFTLPIWLDIFPKAKVINICRHGVDVANSLKVRDEKRLINHNSASQYRNWKYWIRKKRGGFCYSPRCQSLSEGLLLWENYMKEAQLQVREKKDNFLEIKYEDFLLDPLVFLETLASFCGLKSDSFIINSLVQKVDQTRIYAYENDEHLKSFAQQNVDVLKRYGYSA